MDKGSRRSGKKKRRDFQNILSLASVLGANTDQQITWFQKKGLIARNKCCPSCNQAMNMQSGNDVTDQCSLIKMVIKN